MRRCEECGAVLPADETGETFCAECCSVPEARDGEREAMTPEWDRLRALLQQIIDYDIHDNAFVGTDDLAREALDAVGVLLEKTQQAEDALDAIARNAESWHGPPGDGGHERALAVIAKWARDPGTIPAAILAARSVREETPQ